MTLILAWVLYCMVKAEWLCCVYRLLRKTFTNDDMLSMCKQQTDISAAVRSSCQRGILCLERLKTFAVFGDQGSSPSEGVCFRCQWYGGRHCWDPVSPWVTHQHAWVSVQWQSVDHWDQAWENLFISWEEKETGLFFFLWKSFFSVEVFLCNAESMSCIFS